MQEWFGKEWRVLQVAISASKSDVCYCLETLKGQLLHLFVVWEWSIIGVPAGPDLPGWGPSQGKIECTQGEYILGGGVDNVKEEMLDVEFEAEADDLLTEHLDSLWITEYYCNLNNSSVV
ncbi:hypothetical protein GYMLUDRAFT_251733 [Collybiopsis luxurians FD-317 M1]|uniref:Uncharacterized protein n=1 Tax=Collybiopsis luxurians FD-317 M1 TaxID=944289 RepID=A0A0D0ANH7_9AGAR|nr:hypothetical protein GYMLUDRAFT_251733 [Collybiopsis luxurians FD-317 M1]